MTRPCWTPSADFHLYVFLVLNPVGCLCAEPHPPPDDAPPISVTSKPAPRPVSPDGPKIINELRRYTGGGAGSGPVSGVRSERVPESGAKPPQTKNASAGAGNTSQRDVIQPNTNAVAAQDLRTGSKRKASTPTQDERPGKQARHRTAPPASQGFAFGGGFGLPPLGLNPAVLGRPLYRPPYYQTPPMGDPGYMYPDLFGSTSAATTAASSSSSPPSSSVSGPLPPYVAGLLPPGFPLSYPQSLAGLYAGLPGPAATPGPSGASFLSQYPPAASSSASSASSPSSLSSSARSEGHQGPVPVDGGNMSSSGSDDEEDVIEVGGQRPGT